MKKNLFFAFLFIAMNLSAQIRFTSRTYTCYLGAPQTYQCAGNIQNGTSSLNNNTYSIIQGNSVGSVSNFGGGCYFNTSALGFSTVRVTDNINNSTDTTVVEVVQYVGATGISVASTYHTMNTLGSTYQVQASPVPTNATLLSGNISYHLVSGTCISLSTSGLVTAIANGTATVESRLYYGIQGQYYVGTTTIVVNTATSVENMDDKTNISIYPNPNKGEFFLEHHLDFAHILVKDLLGRTIHAQISQHEDKTIIQMPTTATGFYIVSILDKNHVQVAQSKILVQP